MWRRGLQYNVGSSMVCGETIAIIMGTSLSMHADKEDLATERESPRALSGSWIGRECVEYSGDFLMLITRLELGTNTRIARGGVEQNILVPRIGSIR